MKKKKKARRSITIKRERTVGRPKRTLGRESRFDLIWSTSIYAETKSRIAEINKEVKGINKLFAKNNGAKVTFRSSLYRIVTPIATIVVQAKSDRHMKKALRELEELGYIERVSTEMRKVAVIKRNPCRSK